MKSGRSTVLGGTPVLSITAGGAIVIGSPLVSTNRPICGGSWNAFPDSAAWKPSPARKLKMADAAAFPSEERRFLIAANPTGQF